MKKVWAIALTAVLFGACKKDDKTNQSAQGTDFKSIVQFDAESNHIGSLGDPLDDYKQENWPDWVYNLFEPLDTVDLTGYREHPDLNVQSLYPNPCGLKQTMKYFSVEPANLKVVIIDDQKNVHLLKSIHLFNTNAKVAFDYKGLSLIPGTYYRMFFGFSAENKPFFRRGHIDILIQ
ncbi:MAG TPA: hypothetical protein VL098_03740 [Flavipsychrobacter sp.]|nr:hypothetical protein [Flavipsychrobacter sp.]